MKQSKLLFLFVVLMSMASYKSYAHDIAVENEDGVTIYYDYINEGNELAVTYKGYSYYFYEPSYSGNIIIPENVTFMNRTRKVTCISGEAFRHCDVESVYIPSSVSTIGRSAFAGCNKLVSIIIPSGVIEEGAFAYCGALEKVIIGDGVTTINIEAFNNCSNLTTVVMGKSLEAIYKNAFQGCDKLDVVVVKDIAAWCNVEISLESQLPRHLYSDENTEIKDLIIPEGVRIIKERVFDDQYYLKQRFKTVTFPTTLESIEYQNETLFNNTKVIIKDIAAWCNADIHHNARVYYSMFYENGEPIKNLMIPNGVTSIKRDNFFGCTNIESVSFPQSIESIQGFRDCNNLSRIVLNEGVTNIGSYAFLNCNLSYLRIPSSVETIEIDAFANDNLSTVVSLIKNPFDISEYTFSNNTIMNATLYVPEGTIDLYKSAKGWKAFKFIEEGTGPNSGEEVPDVPEEPSGDAEFGVVDGIKYGVKGNGTLEVTGLEAGTTIVDILSDVTIDGKTYQVTSIGERAFEGRSDIEYLSIPWSVTSIGEYAFIDCGSNLTVNIADPESWCQMELGNEHSSPLSSAGRVLVHDIETTSIDIPVGVTSIGNFTFYQCHCITSLNIPGTVRSIGSSAFEDCTGLTSLSLSEGLEIIGGSAFQGCTGLQTLTIPSTVNAIYINALAGFKAITDVYCFAENVPDTHTDAFDATPTEKSTLHVPANAVEAYRKSWPWSDFKEIVAIEQEDPDAIQGVKQSDDSKTEYYDLTGRRVYQPQKGLYIKNGKKIMIK